MESLTIRELRNRPGLVQEQLAEGGELLLTNNGRPVALMLAVDGSTLDETLEAVRRVRGQLALRALRQQARDQGLDKLTGADIQELIQEARAARH